MNMNNRNRSSRTGMSTSVTFSLASIAAAIFLEDAEVLVNGFSVVPVPFVKQPTRTSASSYEAYRRDITIIGGSKSSNDDIENIIDDNNKGDTNDGNDSAITSAAAAAAAIAGTGNGNDNKGGSTKRGFLLFTLFMSSSSMQMSLSKPKSTSLSGSDVEESSNWWTQVKYVNNRLWDYVVNFLYVVISLGIILNIAGYAYTIDEQEGLRIIPIKQHREELQWKQEIQRYDRMYDNSNSINNIENKQILNNVEVSSSSVSMLKLRDDN